MNVIDVILLICFVPALILGVKKGFITQAVALIALILGAWLSYKFAVPVAQWMQGVTNAPGTILQVVAFIIIFIAVFFGLEFLGRLLTKTVRIVMLGWADRLLGIVFAFAKVFLVIGLLILLFDAINTKFELVKPETINGSLFYNPLKQVANVVFPYLKELIFAK